MLLVDVVVFTLALFPAFGEIRKERIGMRRSVMDEGQTEPVGYRHGFFIYGISTYYIYVFSSRASRQCFVKAVVEIATGEIAGLSGA